MARQVTVYGILIASPADVVKERQAIPEVIHSWNAVNSRRYGVMLEPVLWETHASPEMGDRPQSIINRQLFKDCDILIGTFWTRLGTHTGKAESGTVEEIEEFRKVGKPVLLYFSSVPVVPDSVDAEQYKRLRDFKEKCRGEGIVFDYDSIGDLREKLPGHITKTIDSLKEGSPEVTVRAETGEDRTQYSALKMFKSQFETFLRRLEAEWNAERDSDPMKTDEGKYILDRACSEVIDFQAQIVSDEGTRISEILNEATRRLKAIQRHQTYMDGGKSFLEFWEEGTRIIDLLKSILGEISELLQKAIP